MLEHTPQEGFTPTIRPTATHQTPSALSAQRQTQMESHLKHLCARVAAEHPEQSPATLRQEMELRLAELVLAHEEMGNNQDSATITALQQLRREYVAPVAMQQVKRRMGLHQKYPWLRPTLLPLSLFSLFYIADVTKFAWRVWAQLFGIAIDDNGSILTGGDTSATDVPFYRFELFVVPLLVGVITGLLLRKGAGRAVLHSLALLAVVAILLPGFVYGLGIAGILSGWSSSVQLPSFVPGVAGATFWVTLGYGGAQLGSWLGRHGSRLTRFAQRARRKAIG